MQEKAMKRIWIAIVLCFAAATLAIGILSAALAIKRYKSMPPESEPASTMEIRPWRDSANFMQYREPEQGDGALSQ
jgi:hypothetical protein